MPVLDGFRATQMIKADTSINGVPVIALTGTVMKESEAEISEVCDGFLKKPIDRQELVSELARFLTHSIGEPTSTFSAAVQPERGVTVVREALDSETLAKLPELVQALVSQKDACEEMRSTLRINDVEDFATKMRELGDDGDQGNRQHRQ